MVLSIALNSSPVIISSSDNDNFIKQVCVMSTKFSILVNYTIVGLVDRPHIHSLLLIQV